MASETNIAQLEGLYKHTYADKIENLKADSSIIEAKIPLQKRDQRPGNRFNQPVKLTYEHGATYAGPDAGGFNLEQSVALNHKNAEVVGSQFMLRGTIPYDAIFRSLNSKGAFMDATQTTVEVLMESASKRKELSFLYGQSDTGIAQPTASANVSATSTTLTISVASFTIGTWSGMKDCPLDLYHAAAQVNTVAALVVSAVDFTNRTITVTGDAADITAVDALAYDATTKIVFRTAEGNEMAGIDKIMTNTGTLFGIDASQYDLWRSNIVDVGGADLTFGKVNKGLANAVSLGLDTEIDLFVNPATWSNLNDDLSALRRFDHSFKSSEGTIGNQAIRYYSQNGAINIHSHRFVKPGDAFAMPLSKWTRVGSSDTTFNGPGMSERTFIILENKAAVEMRVYWNEAIFTRCPARSLKFTNIVNS